MKKSPAVYIITNRKNGTLYTGVTSNLHQRIYQHRTHQLKGFSDQYNLTKLVWFAQGSDMLEAITLEKKIKNRSRKWKIDLIEKENPDWKELAHDWYELG